MPHTGIILGSHGQRRVVAAFRARGKYSLTRARSLAERAADFYEGQLPPGQLDPDFLHPDAAIRRLLRPPRLPAGGSGAIHSRRSAAREGLRLQLRKTGPVFVHRYTRSGTHGHDVSPHTRSRPD